MGSQERMMPIVLYSVSSGERKVDEEDEGRRYHQVDFTMVDLDTGEVCLEFLPSMYCCTGFGNMVKLGEDPATLYVIGGVRTPFEMSEKLLKLKDEKHPGYYMGACRASASGGEASWQHIDLPNTKQNLHGCIAAMMGRIYCFGYPGLRPEVYDPMLDKWDDLSIPEEVLKLPPKKSPPVVVPDPQNNRILLQLCRGCLHAFYPSDSEEGGGGDWVCLSKGFEKWSEVVAVVDNVLYFHHCESRSSLCAYDLTTGKWLHVVWSTMVIDGVNMGYLEFSALFGAGEGVLCCLAHWGAVLDFIKITVQRTSPSALRLTPISFKSFTIPSADMLLNMVPLKNELRETMEIKPLLSNVEVMQKVFNSKSGDRVVGLGGGISGPQPSREELEAELNATKKQNQVLTSHVEVIQKENKELKDRMGSMEAQMKMFQDMLTKKFNVSLPSPNELNSQDMVS